MADFDGISTAEIISKYGKPKEEAAAQVVDAGEVDVLDPPVKEIKQEEKPKVEKKSEKQEKKADTKTTVDKTVKADDKKIDAATKEVKKEDSAEAEFVLTPQEEAMQKVFSAEKPKEGEETKIPEIKTQVATDKTEVKKITAQSIDEDTRTKLNNYDVLVAHPLFEPLVAYIQGGGKELFGFIKQLNVADPNKMELQDFIRMEAESVGVKAEDMDEVVAQELESFEGLTSLQKSKKLKEYRDNFEKSQTESLKKYTVKENEEQKRIEELSRTSRTSLQNKVNSLVKDSADYKESGGKQGQLYSNFLLIDEPMAQKIMELAGPLSMQLTDDSGQIVGHDIDLGIRAAINELYGRQKDENIYKTGYAIGRKEAMKERHRPSENSTASGAAPDVENKMESNLATYKKNTFGI